MNDHAVRVWLPYAAFALSIAAFSLGAPAKLARKVHASPAARARAEMEGAMRDEPVIFPMAAPLRSIGALLPAQSRLALLRR